MYECIQRANFCLEIEPPNNIVKTKPSDKGIDSPVPISSAKSSRSVHPSSAEDFDALSDTSVLDMDGQIRFP